MKSVTNKSTALPRRAAFTLVEMLVATALVVLIMLMFAQVFGMATNAMSRMRGMAELDQGARTITTVLANDIHNRTFRDVQPFWRNQIPSNVTVGYFPDARRAGYFYISENDPRSTIDDVLQLTVDVGNNIERSGTPFARGESPAVAARRDPSQRDPQIFGKTVQLVEPFPDLRPSPSGDPSDPAYIDNLNQPDFDDGRGPVEVSPGVFVGSPPDGLGASQYAEVAYFLRNGNLYRRVLLVRQPYDETISGASGQPQGIMGQYDPPDTENGSGQFWRDFDYSAWFDESGGTPNVRFAVSLQTGTDYLSNTDTSVTGSGFPESLGVPYYRFGHTVYRNDGTIMPSPIPREFRTYANAAIPGDWPFDLTPGNPTFPYAATPPAMGFMGRFTVHECSHDDFGYPGRIHIDGATGARRNPMDPATTLNFDSRYHITEYATGNTERRGDDLLMSNVHSFDVQVWDDIIGEYLDLGHGETNSGGTPGRFHYSRNTNSDYGNRFDTWHLHTAMPDPPYYPSDPPVPAGTDGATLQINGPQERRLRSIRISIRYQDVSTGSMRTVVGDFSLIDPGQEYK